MAVVSESTRNVVWQVYSEVLFELARQMELLDPIVEDLSRVAAVLKAEGEFARLLNSQSVEGDEKVEIVRRVFSGRVSELTLNFFCVLVRRGRVGFLSGICDRYETLVDTYRKRQLVEVTVAKEVDGEAMAGLKAELGDAIAGEVKLSVKVDPEIIGGIIIKKDDRVIDHSVKRILERAVKSIMKKTQADRASRAEGADEAAK